MKKCCKCKVEKPESEFYKNKKMKDGLDYYCKECRKNQIYANRLDKNYYHDNRDFIESLKHPCEKCGEERSYLIQFHHVNPENKKFNLALCGTRSKSTIWAEACKCVCLCSNCHDEFHHIYGKNPEDPGKALMEYLYT